MSAPITEAHRKLACDVLLDHSVSGAATKDGVIAAAQLIADSEALACAQLRAALTVAENWVEHHSQHADDLIAQNAELRDRVAAAQQREATAIASWDEERNRALREGERVVEWRDRAERAEAELKERSPLNIWGGTPGFIHAFVKRQQARIHAAQDIEVELAAERARLDWLMAGGVCMMQHSGGFHISRLHTPVSRAAIDAAMKEDAK